jgi:hypothetical protein
LRDRRRADAKPRRETSHVLIPFAEDGDDPQSEWMREQLQDIDDPLEGGC